MKTVHKLALGQIAEQEMAFPLNSTILSLQNQKNAAVLYVHCDPDEERKVKRTIYAALTGQEAPNMESVDYLGTVMYNDDSFVVHFFISK